MMKAQKYAIALILLGCMILTGTASRAQEEADAPPLLVHEAWLLSTVFTPFNPNLPPLPPPEGLTASLYMTLENTGERDLRLVGVTTPVAGETQMHSMSMSADGVMRMEQQEGFDLPAGETVTFTTGSAHVMLVDLQRDLYSGDVIALTLTLEEVDGTVMELPAAALVLEFPPEPAELAARARLVENSEGTLALELTLLNNGVESVALAGVQIALPVSLVVSEPPNIEPMMFDPPQEIAAEEETLITAPDAVPVEWLSMLRAGDALAVVLRFQPEGELTVPVALPLRQPRLRDQIESGTTFFTGKYITG